MDVALITIENLVEIDVTIYDDIANKAKRMLKGKKLAINCRGARITEIPQRIKPGRGILRSDSNVVNNAMAV